MEKTNKKILEEIIRVDHAGERGAIKIYEGQLLALKTIKQDNDLKDKIEEMKEQEKKHLEYFEKEIQKRKIKPTYLLPLWDVMGVTLGFGSALLGKKAAMLCTASVEEVIDDLIKIKGIGRWTAEMFLIFYLLRSNVFPCTDIGLLRAISINYNLKYPLKDSEIKKFKKKWMPWSTVATWYLWRSLDPVSVEY